jgi:hypothetical protein
MDAGWKLNEHLAYPPSSFGVKRKCGMFCIDKSTPVDILFAGKWY